MHATKKNDFVRAMQNPFSLAKYVSHLTNCFDDYIKLAEKVKNDRDLAKAVLKAFKEVSNAHKITADLFTKANGSQITALEFSMLTNLEALDEEGLCGPDDIFPWDKVLIIPAWKFAMLAVLLSQLCDDVSPTNILEGQNILS